eukprot:jgi/Bigna1/145350/aug1.98_g20058
MKAPNRDRGPASALAVPSVVGERHAMSQNSPFSSDSGLGSRVLLGLCLVGFFVNCQPSEPFLTRFLIENKGLTEKQLDNTMFRYVDSQVFRDYGSECAGIILQFSKFSLRRYRRVVLVGLLCREATRVILIFANGVFMMAVMQLTYAAATCANTVYYAYAYQVVAPSKFVRTTGYMRAAYHGGNVAGIIVVKTNDNESSVYSACDDDDDGGGGGGGGGGDSDDGFYNGEYIVEEEEKD